MGVDYVYSLARDDVDAGGAVSRPGGPQGRPEVAGSRRTGLFRTAPIVTELGPGYPGVAVRGVHPVVAPGTLAELLTGVPFDTLLEDPRHGADVAATASGDRMVLTVTDRLRDRPGRGRRHRPGRGLPRVGRHRGAGRRATGGPD